MHLLVVKVTVTVIFVALVLRYELVPEYAIYRTISAISAQTDYYNFVGLLGCCLMLLVYRVAWLYFLNKKLWRRYGFASRKGHLVHEEFCKAKCNGCCCNSSRWKKWYAVVIFIAWSCCTLATIGVFGLCVMGDRADDNISKWIHNISTLLFFLFEFLFQVLVVVLLALTFPWGPYLHQGGKIQSEVVVENVDDDDDQENQEGEEEEEDSTYCCPGMDKYCVFIFASTVKLIIALFCGISYIVILATAEAQPGDGIYWLNRLSVGLEFAYIFAMTTFDLAEILRFPICYPRRSSVLKEEFLDELAERNVGKVETFLKLFVEKEQETSDKMTDKTEKKKKKGKKKSGRSRRRRNKNEKVVGGGGGGRRRNEEEFDIAGADFSEEGSGGGLKKKKKKNEVVVTAVEQVVTPVSLQDVSEDDGGVDDDVFVDEDSSD